MCGNASESVTHITSLCQKLAQTQYKHRHDKVGKKIHWLLSKKYNLECTDKWYQHSPESVAENEEVKILWDFMIQTDRVIEHRRPDIVVVEKIGGKCFIIDIAVSGDHNVQQKELEKKTKYEDLRIEIARLWNKEISVIPVVVGALGTLTANLKKNFEGIRNSKRHPVSSEIRPFGHSKYSEENSRYFRLWVRARYCDKSQFLHE